MDKKKRKSLVENIKSFAFAIFVVLLIRSSVIEAFKIPSGSMIPTLFIGDNIFVNKFTYGVKLPFYDWIANDPLYLTKTTMPERGDVIVFKYPLDESVHYIKRVIGLPGDRIRVERKALFINGQPVPRKRITDPAVIDAVIGNLDWAYDKTTLELYEEDVPGTTKKHWVILDSVNNNFEDFPEVTVPEGKIFAMGDDRDYSADSRVWGFVPFKNVRGKAMFIWLNIWIDLDKSQFFFHPSRIGKLIR
jgi:signal peptidase I